MIRKCLIFAIVLFFSLQALPLLSLESTPISSVFASHNNLLFGNFILSSDDLPIPFINSSNHFVSYSLPHNYSFLYGSPILLYSSFEVLDFNAISIEEPPLVEKPFCFLIKNIKFVPLGIEEKDIQKMLKKFSFVTKISKSYLNSCMGSKQINEFLNKLNFKAIQEGYITTKFGLLPQDLNMGILKIGIEIGFVGDIEYADEGQMFFFAKDFGIKKGDVLNLGVLELGITNLKRLKYLSPTTKIIPMQEDFKSKILISTNVKSLPLFIQALFDNASSVKAGYEGTFLLGVENPLHLADSLQIYLLGSIPFSKTDHSYYASLSYSIPIRRFLIQIDSSYTHNSNQLSLYSISPIYSVQSINAEVKTSYLIYVDSKNQVFVGLGLSRRFSDSYLEKIKLDIQTKILSEISSFISYKRYFVNSQFSVILSLLQGVPLFGSNKSFDKKTTYLYTIPSINLYLYHPFSLWKSLFVYSPVIKTQISRDQLYASEKMTIGGRYSVRGFNHFSLSAQMGVLVRNDLMMYLPSFWGITLAPSLGADMGYVKDLVGDNKNAGFLSGGGVGIQLFSKYFNAQIWGYAPFYNPYNASTLNLFFSVGMNW